jgi:hypothetical protein
MSYKTRVTSSVTKKKSYKTDKSYSIFITTSMNTSHHNAKMCVGILRISVLWAARWVNKFKDNSETKLSETQGLLTTIL